MKVLPWQSLSALFRSSLSSGGGEQDRAGGRSCERWTFPGANLWVIMMKAVTARREVLEKPTENPTFGFLLA